MHHWELRGSCLVYRAQPGGAVFNPSQVTGDCAPAFSSRSRLHVDICYCRENPPCWRRESTASLHAVGLGPRSSQEVHQRPGTKPERHVGVWPWLACGSCSGPEDRSLSLKAGLETPHRASHCPVLTAPQSWIWDMHTRAGLGSRQVSSEEGKQLCLETHILENDPCVMKATVQARREGTMGSSRVLCTSGIGHSGLGGHGRL